MLRHSVQGRVHIWDSGNIIADIGTETVYYIRVLTLIYAKKGETKTYYRFNGHGDVIALANSSGAIIKRYKYDSFGVEENPGIFDTNVFRYCGEYYDAETKTIYLRARYYDAETGRFTQQDGWSYAVPGFLLSLNLYTYCWNNPVSYMDPSGRAPKKPVNKKTGIERIAEDVATEISILEKMGKTPSTPKKPLGNTKTNKERIEECIEAEKALAKEMTCINGQGVDPRVKDKKLGLCNMSYNGCEAIAVYNARVLTGDPVPINDVIEWCEDNALWMGGIFGCYYGDLKHYFNGIDNYDVDAADYKEISYANSSKDYSLLNEILDASDVVIMSFWNSGVIPFCGIHTVAVRKNENGMLVYNYSNTRSTPRRFDNLDKYLSENGFLLSYFGVSRR